MKLGDIAIDLRWRTPWEAIDLGAAMYRSWFKPLLLTWAAVFVPVLCLCAGLLRDHLWAAWLVVWWLKPLFERFLLHIASRAAFGACPGVAETLRAWREILSPLPWLWITLARPFYLQRGYTVPVSQLERQRGAERRTRERVLGRRAMSSGTWLAVICAHFELSIALSVYVLGALLGPSQAIAPGDFVQRLTAGGRSPFDIADLLIQATATSLIAPFFICSGFALYLNRRSQLEAWDIEVGLRRIEERIASRPRGLPAAAATVVLLSLSLWLLPPFAATASAAAQASAAAGTAAGAPASADVSDADARAALERVLAAPEFQIYRREKHWQARNPSKPEPPAPAWEGLASLLQFIAESARAVLWIAAAVLAVLLLSLVARRRRSPPAAPARSAAPEVILGMQISPDSLPADIAAAARERLRQGEPRAALALLYRGALSALAHRRSVELGPGATESDVLRACRRALDGGDAAYFELLVRGWSAAAYAGRPPETAEGEALCRDWTQHFGSAAA